MTDSKNYSSAEAFRQHLERIVARPKETKPETKRQRFLTQTKDKKRAEIITMLKAEPELGCSEIARRLKTSRQRVRFLAKRLEAGKVS